MSTPGLPSGTPLPGTLEELLGRPELRAMVREYVRELLAPENGTQAPQRPESGPAPLPGGELVREVSTPGGVTRTPLPVRR